MGVVVLACVFAGIAYPMVLAIEWLDGQAPPQWLETVVVSFSIALVVIVLSALSWVLLGERLAARCKRYWANRC
jgi:hypothetical protein